MLTIDTEYTTASATEVKNHFGEYLEKARHAPVTVEKAGRSYVVMVSCEEYERLQAFEDQLWGMAAAEAEKSGYIGPEETMKLLTRYAD